MKKTLIAAAVIILSAVQAFAQTPTEIPWYGNKYSMFIHFGVYSSLGGVWKGKPITYGYSEQIQAHAGIYSDVYEDVARTFNPSRFDADAIAKLARDAGMRSIVITSKHHDGFCLFKTSTTTFNSWDTPELGVYTEMDEHRVFVGVPSFEGGGLGGSGGRLTEGNDGTEA